MTTPPAAPARLVVPEWLVNVAALGWRILVSTTLGVVLIGIALELMTVTASILVAVIISATFAPFALRLRDRGWSRVKTAGVVTLGAFLSVVATLLLIALAFVPYVPQVVAAVEAAVTQMQATLASIASPPEFPAALKGLLVAVQSTLRDALGSLVGEIASAFTIGLLALFLTFFLLMDGDKAWAWAFQAVTGDRRQRVHVSGHDALERVGGYLRGTAILAAVHAVTDLVFMVMLGVPLAAPLSVLVFVGGFIPYVGGAIATITILLVTYTTLGTTAALTLLVLITIVDIIAASFLRPVIYGKTVHIHPALILIALPIGAAMAGIIGLFVAIPVVAILTAVSGAAIAILDPGPEHDPPGLVPGWLDRLAGWSWRLLIAIALGAVAIAAVLVVPAVTVSVILATVFAATLHPLVLLLVRRGWRRGVAAVTATGGTILVVLVIVGLTAITLASQAETINSTSTDGASAINDATGGSVGWFVGAVQSYGLGAAAAVIGIVAAVGAIAVLVVLSALLCFYFLRDGGRFWHSLVSRRGGERAHELDMAGSKAIGVLGGYMVGTGAISVFGAVTQFLIMTLLGLPLALPLAVLSFFGGFIPYIGSFVTTGLAFLVTVAVGTPQDILVMLIFTVVFNIVQGNFVAPLVYGKAVNLHPAVVLMAIPAGSEIAGIMGMFLAVPFLGVVAATWRTVLSAFANEAPPVTAAPHEEPSPEPAPPTLGAESAPDGSAA